MANEKFAISYEDVQGLFRTRKAFGSWSTTGWFCEIDGGKGTEAALRARRKS